MSFSDDNNSDDEYYSSNEDNIDNTVLDSPAPKKTLNKRKSMPASIKQNIWIKYCGTSFNHKCYITWCNTEMTTFSFEVGHNIPHSLGGSIDIENLRPICSKCNKSMGNRYTIDEWNNLVINNIKPDIEPVVEEIPIKNIDFDSECSNDTNEIIGSPENPIVIVDSDSECSDDETNKSVNKNIESENIESENIESENKYYDVDANDSPIELVRKLRHNAEIHRIKIMNSGKK
jgi:hypothetical protein